MVVGYNMTFFRVKNYSSGCGVGPMNPEVVKSTAYNSRFAASNVFVLGEVDAMVDGQANHWLAEYRNTDWQGFIIKLDNCTRLVVGFLIKNMGQGSPKYNYNWSTKRFRVSGLF